MDRDLEPISRIEKFLFALMRLSATFLPTLALIGIVIGDWFAFIGIFTVFGATFLVEVFMKLIGISITMKNEELQKKFFLTSDQSIMLCSVQHFIFIPGVLTVVCSVDSVLTTLGALLSAGSVIASVSALAAHELMHRQGPFYKALSFSIYISFLYSHFSLAHIQGHHKYIALDSDWNTARYGESFYSFFIRAVKGSFLFAWQSEMSRMKRLNRSSYSLKNRVMFGMLAQLIILALVFLSLGAPTTIFYALMCFLGITFIEAVNYISHYGLQRFRDAQGRPGPILDSHAWNCLNKVSNWFLFETAQHAHHHLPNREKTFGKGDRLPPITASIPTLVLFSFAPPLFFSQMNNLIKKENCSSF